MVVRFVEGFDARLWQETLARHWPWFLAVNEARGLSTLLQQAPDLARVFERGVTDSIWLAQHADKLTLLFQG